MRTCLEQTVAEPFPQNQAVGKKSGKNEGDQCQISGVVPQEGLEPPHPCEYQILSLARLPVPPLGPAATARGADAIWTPVTSVLPPADPSKETSESKAPRSLRGRTFVQRCPGVRLA